VVHPALTALPRAVASMWPIPGAGLRNGQVGGRLPLSFRFMKGFLLRVLAPARVRRAVIARLDARYVTRRDHRDDIKDSLWEVQALRREVAELRRDVERLRDRWADAARDPHGPGSPGGPDARVDAGQVRRWDDAHRLALETAASLDHVLQNEVLLWQAVDRLEARLDTGGDAARARGGAASRGGAA
jgi:hypothetical protein